MISESTATQFSLMNSESIVVVFDDDSMRMSWISLPWQFYVTSNSVFTDNLCVTSDLVFADDFYITSDLIFTDDFCVTSDPILLMTFCDSNNLISLTNSISEMI
jgi:hypothetical protein